MIVYTDGSVRGTRLRKLGSAGAGVFIQAAEPVSLAQPLGVTSIMTAEASAMLLGIEMASSMPWTTLVVRTDCKTLADQLEHPTWGKKNKDAAYRDLLARLRERITPNIRVEWVPRELNTIADGLARAAARAV